MSLDHSVATSDAASVLASATDPLPRGSIYRSVAARRQFLEAYDRIVARLNIPVRGLSVPTRYGRTHLAIGGKRDAAPILILPGMSICAPMMLEFFDYLAATRMLIAPDLVGQPGLSADRVFSPRDNAYGKWLIEVLDALELDRIDIIGPSFGGSIALDLAALQPKRVGKLALISTAGLTPSMPYLSAYAPLFVTWMGYRYLPYRPMLEPIATAMCRKWEPRNLDYLDLVIRTSSFWRHRPAGMFAAGQFKDTIEPVFIAFSRRDILLPFERTREHARKALPIGQEMVMEQAHHMPGREDAAPIEAELKRFFG